MKLRLSIQWRIALAFTLLLFIVMAIVSAYLVGFIRDELLRALPAEAAQRDVDRVVATIAVAGAIVAALFVVLAYLIARRTTRSIRSVAQGARRLATGNLEHRVHALSSDETHELADAFNSMATALRQRINELAEERNTLSAVLSTMSDGVLLIDPQGNIAMANPAAERLLGIELAQGQRRPFLELVRDYEVQQLVTRCRETRTPQHAAVELLHQRAYLSVTAVPLENPGAEGVLLALHDLSEARRVNTTRREFVANVSHELRTPLAAVRAAADTLEGGALDDPSAARQFLARIQREVDRMGRLVQELLELSRLESGQERLNLEPASIQAAVAEALERHHAQAEAAGVALNARLPDALPLVLADGERLQQVLSNLLDNALKFTPRGGSVTVSASEEPGKVWVSVSDTGTGIPDEHLPHIFERFYKVDRSRSGEGVGLGLAISRHIVYAHGGDMKVSSREGEGSTFSFSLPKA